MAVCQYAEIKRKNANLTEEKNRYQKDLKIATEEIDKYQKALKKATEGNPKLIVHLEKCNLGIDFSTYKTNIIQLIKEPKNEIDAIEFYDVIISIILDNLESIKDLPLFEFPFTPILRTLLFINLS